jgi:hypothetical protein
LATGIRFSAEFLFTTMCWPIFGDHGPSDPVVEGALPFYVSSTIRLYYAVLRHSTSLFLCEVHIKVAGRISV